MTPKDKAKELFDKMVSTYYITSDFCYDSTAKLCAIAAVDEAITALENNVWQNQKYIDYYKEVRYILEEM